MISPMSPHNDLLVEGKGTWTPREHSRFLAAIQIYPNGPWKIVAHMVGTRTVRQTQTHAQKYREKMARHRRGLRMKHCIDPLHSPTSSLGRSESRMASPTQVYDSFLPFPQEDETYFDECVDYLLNVLCATPSPVVDQYQSYNV